MTTLSFCTYFDGGYASRAIALFRSLAANESDFTLTALCLDEDALDAVRDVNDARLRPLPLSTLEHADPELTRVRTCRSRYEYYFTVGPSLMRYLLDRADVDLLTYLDADLCFYSSPAPLFDESAEAAVTIVAHRFPRRLEHLEETGRYNVAWVGFRNDENGRACLEWWRAQCLDWCYDRVEPGRYADQKYLDEFPTRFSRVHVLQHPGADVAPWNLMDPPLRDDGGRYTVAGVPLIFFHFQGLKRRSSWLLDPNLAAYDNNATSSVRRLYRDYAHRLEALGSRSPSLTSPRRTETHSLVRGAATSALLLARRQLIVSLAGRRAW